MRKTSRPLWSWTHNMQQIEFKNKLFSHDDPFENTFIKQTCILVLGRDFERTSYRQNVSFWCRSTFILIDTQGLYRWKNCVRTANRNIFMEVNRNMEMNKYERRCSTLWRFSVGNSLVLRLIVVPGTKCLHTFTGHLISIIVHSRGRPHSRHEKFTLI